MRIAVIDHIGNFGGGSRFTRALLPALKSCRPEIKIVFFGNRRAIVREGLKHEFGTAGINIRGLASSTLVSKGIFGGTESSAAIRYLQGRFADRLRPFPSIISGNVTKELEKKIKGFDLAFFPWPFLIKFPELRCPSVAVIHDFNFKYFFSSFPPYRTWQIKLLEREIPEWIKRSFIILSSHFMARELDKFYPVSDVKTSVIHMAPFGNLAQRGKDLSGPIADAVKRIRPFILYPTNIHSHKNLGPLFAAINHLKRRGHEVRLVLTGPKTEMVNGAASEIGVVKQDAKRDVIGLGYVSNEEMDFLIKCASIVVSSSLYEAGNGPGLEAWNAAVPVAMSGIPAFVEQMRTFGVKAEIFDPRSPEDIADKLEKILTRPEKAKADAMRSQAAIKRYSWKMVAEKYLAVFQRVIEERAK